MTTGAQCRRTAAVAYVAALVLAVLSLFAPTGIPAAGATEPSSSVAAAPSFSLAYGYDAAASDTSGATVYAALSDAARRGQAGNPPGASTGGLSADPANFIAAEEGTAVSRAASCLNSFTGDTPVTLADGSRKPIGDVKIGDKVLATDPETGQTKAEPVVQLIRHSGAHVMVLITLADGSTLDSTDGHPIWDATSRRFTDASGLHLGDKIETH